MGRPAMNQVGQKLELHLRRGELSGGLAGPDAQAVVDGPVEGGRVAEENGMLTLEVTHFLDDIDPLRRVEHLVEDSSALEPEIHQREIDIVVAASSRLQ